MSFCLYFFILLVLADVVDVVELELDVAELDKIEVFSLFAAGYKSISESALVFSVRNLSIFLLFAHVILLSHG